MSDTDRHSEHSARGNTLPRARGWCFTLNNYNSVDLDTLNTLKSSLDQYIYGFENAPETGTPHIQGYLYWKNPRNFDYVKSLLPNAHIEKAKGTPADNGKYCSKCGNFDTNMKIAKPVKIIQELRSWQAFIEQTVLSEPDDRTIYWFWEPDGNTGKTSLIKYLLVKYDFCEFSRATKTADIVTVANPNKTCYLFDFARTQEGFAPYNALEQLKDGLISDSKLKKETRNIIMNPPHVICFANWEPDTDTLSSDRWNITRIMP